MEEYAKDKEDKQLKVRDGKDNIDKEDLMRNGMEERIFIE